MRYWVCIDQRSKNHEIRGQLRRNLHVLETVKKGGVFFSERNRDLGEKGDIFNLEASQVAIFK